MSSRLPPAALLPGCLRLLERLRELAVVLTGAVSRLHDTCRVVANALRPRVPLALVNSCRTGCAGLVYQPAEWQVLDQRESSMGTGQPNP